MRLILKISQIIRLDFLFLGCQLVFWITLRVFKQIDVFGKSELRSCVKVEVDVLGSRPTVSVDVKQHLTNDWQIISAVLVLWRVMCFSCWPRRTVRLLVFSERLPHTQCYFFVYIFFVLPCPLHRPDITALVGWAWNRKLLVPCEKFGSPYLDKAQ